MFTFVKNVKGILVLIKNLVMKPAQSVKITVGESQNDSKSKARC